VAPQRRYWRQISAGMNTQFCKKNWITECWRYLSLCNASVTISGLWAPTKGILKDVALMSEFTRHGLSDKQKRDANRSRIYLRAFYVSDITDLGGKSIEEWTKQGKWQATRTLKWNWSVQQRPPAASWKKWQMVLHCISSEDGDLFQHSGPRGDIKNSHQNIECNLDAGAMTLYRHTEGT
jgi:hypothetical protein